MSKCIHYLGDWVAYFLIAWVFEFSIYSSYALLDVKLESIFQILQAFSPLSQLFPLLYRAFQFYKELLDNYWPYFLSN